MVWGGSSVSSDGVIRERDFPCDLVSPRVARRFVVGVLAGRPTSLVEDAELLVSEVVTRIVVLGCQSLKVSVDAGTPVAVAITYTPSPEMDPDRVPGPVAPRLAARTRRIELSRGAIQHVFFLQAEPATASR